MISCRHRRPCSLKKRVSTTASSSAIWQAHSRMWRRHRPVHAIAIARPIGFQKLAVGGVVLAIDLQLPLQVHPFEDDLIGEHLVDEAASEGVERVRGAGREHVVELELLQPLLAARLGVSWTLAQDLISCPAG